MKAPILGWDVGGDVGHGGLQGAVYRSKFRPERVDLLSRSAG